MHSVAKRTDSELMKAKCMFFGLIPDFFPLQKSAETSKARRKLHF